MENYAIKILQEALSKELREKVISQEMTNGKGFSMDTDTMKAFNRVIKEANSRITDLQKALQKLFN